jgi:hypothetical protein
VGREHFASSEGAFQRIALELSVVFIYLSQFKKIRAVPVM